MIISRWGIRDDEETGMSYGVEALSGEFVVVDGLVYFEILFDADRRLT